MKLLWQVILAASVCTSLVAVSPEQKALRESLKKEVSSSQFSNGANYIILDDGTSWMAYPQSENEKLKRGDVVSVFYSPVTAKAELFISNKKFVLADLYNDNSFQKISSIYNDPKNGDYVVLNDGSLLRVVAAKYHNRGYNFDALHWRRGDYVMLVQLFPPGNYPPLQYFRGTPIIVNLSKKPVDEENDKLHLWTRILPPQL